MNFDVALEKIKGLVREVGAFQLGMLDKKHDIEVKSSHHDIVTETDKKSEEMIVEFLQREFPDDGIFAEEGSRIAGKSGYTWVVDPLDGTTNFAHQFPLFCISIGLEKDGEHLLGVVYAPVLDELFYAVRGKGAFLNGSPIHVSSCNDLRRALLATGFAYVREGRYCNLKFFNYFLAKCGGIRRGGSAAYDLCSVAAGRFDGFWEFQLKPWDVSAGAAIIMEAGGIFEDISSEKTGTSLIAGNPGMHRIIRETLDEAGFGKWMETGW